MQTYFQIRIGVEKLNIYRAKTFTEIFEHCDSYYVLCYITLLIFLTLFYIKLFLLKSQPQFFLNPFMTEADII